jgi:hypothetical protein
LALHESRAEVIGVDEPESPEAYLWRAALTALLRTYPPAEAFDRANLVLSAYRRKRSEARALGDQPSEEPSDLDEC